MHLKTVTLRNFRCFKELKLNLHPRLTVLVAENGGGKSAVLDAIRMGLSLYIDTITDTQQKVKFSHTDIQVFQGNYTEQITFEGDCEIAGQSLHWSQALKSSSKSNRLTSKNTRSLTNAAKALRDQVNNFHVNSGQPVPILSLVVSYGTKRLWIDNLRKEKLRINRSNNIRLEGYVGCLGSSASVSTIVGWYEARMKEMGSGQYSTETENYTKVIAGIETAMKVVLEPTGWCELEWDFSKKKLLVKHSVFGSLLLEQLSDGIRTMVVLTMDIARRCSMLNPQFGEDAAQKTPGLVLIDEVDMHLHPRWQQLVLLSLQNAFPLIQFIVTTHSPQVISTVPSESIRIIKEGVVHAATPGTDGAESQRILEEIFQVSPRPQQTPMAQALDQYLRLVDARQWDNPRARELRHKLDAWSQRHEPRLLEADLEIENMKWEAGQ